LLLFYCNCIILISFFFFFFRVVILHCIGQGSVSFLLRRITLQYTSLASRLTSRLLAHLLPLAPSVVSSPSSHLLSYRFSHNGHTGVCKLLISKGADATLTNTKGESVAQVAAAKPLQQFLEGMFR
jgi:hypothetical protein